MITILVGMLEWAFNVTQDFYFWCRLLKFGEIYLFEGNVQFASILNNFKK